jgi:hypothetical protein
VKEKKRDRAKETDRQTERKRVKETEKEGKGDREIE